MKRRECSLLLVATILEGLPTMSSSTEIAEFYERPSGMSFGQTLARLTTVIEGAGMHVFARIDHTAAARDVGLSMPPTTLLLYGNPRGGTPLMLASPAVALDLPLRMLVREDTGGRTFVSFHPVVSMLVRAGVPEVLAMRLAPAQQVLVDALE